MIVWRLCRAPYTVLDGEGARRSGNRWNSAGLAVNYTAATLSLAALEYLVHVDPDLLPEDLVALKIELPDADYPCIQAEELADPDDENWYREKGDSWIRSGASLALIVPSVIIRVENNLLVNPAHPDMERVRVLETWPFHYDARLLQ